MYVHKYIYIYIIFYIYVKYEYKIWYLYKYIYIWCPQNLLPLPSKKNECPFIVSLCTHSNVLAFWGSHILLQWFIILSHFRPSLLNWSSLTLTVTHIEYAYIYMYVCMQMCHIFYDDIYIYMMYICSPWFPRVWVYEFTTANRYFFIHKAAFIEGPSSTQSRNARPRRLFNSSSYQSVYSSVFGWVFLECPLWDSCGCNGSARQF